MRIDQYGLLISEEHDDSTVNGFEGNRGEALATTARYLHLKSVVDEYDFGLVCPLKQLIDEKGFYIRHPQSKWRGESETSDQLIPVVCFYRSLGCISVKTPERTGNGDLISIKLYALLTNKTWLLNTALVGQRLIFIFPWRFNEEMFNQKKWPIESSKNSSADWMNTIHLLFFASPWVRKLFSKDKLKERVRHYYQNEPNVSWMLDLYDRAIERL